MRWRTPLAAALGAATLAAGAAQAAPIAGDHPPRARIDHVTTLLGFPVEVAVLANDSDPDGDLTPVVSWTAPALGTSSCGLDRCTYTPGPFALAQRRDGFEYTIDDTHGLTDSAAVSVHVVPPGTRDSLTITGDAGGPVFFGARVFASSGRRGQAASGSVAYNTLASVPTGGPVTCLTVHGATAVLNTLTRTIDGQTYVATVSATDNGGAGRDLVRVTSGRAPTDCSPVAGPGTPLVNGRAVVFDAVRRP